MGYAKAELGDFQGSLEALTVQSFLGQSAECLETFDMFEPSL